MKINIYEKAYTYLLYETKYIHIDRSGQKIQTEYQNTSKYHEHPFSITVHKEEDTCLPVDVTNFVLRPGQVRILVLAR
jgi:hypothetical protein